jgi:hypothetical protein
MPAVASASIDRVSATEKGSLFFFSKVELRWLNDGAVFPLIQDTFLSLTNDENLPVSVQMYFINGDPATPPIFDGGGALIERAHPGWNSLDNGITLTANQPTYWSAFTGQPAAGGLSPFTALDPGFPPGRPATDGTNDRVLRGYIIGWAVNADGDEIRWNHLAGNGTVVNYLLGHAWEYNTWNYSVVSGVAQGAESDGTAGQLLLNGVEYAESFDTLLFNFQGAGSAAWSGAGRQVVSNTDLTLYPPSVDLRQATNGPVTTKASATIWNMNETKFSGAHRCVTCWDQTFISQWALIPNHFIAVNLQTAHGKAIIEGLAAPVQCDVLDNPDTPQDESVISVDSPLLGVAYRLLIFDGGAAFAAAGYNLVGRGFDDTAVILYDPQGGSQEAEQPGTPPAKNASPTEILDFLERGAQVSTRGAGR